MKIKYFIIIVYICAGLLISILSSFMTYIIIGAPIGKPMIIKIIFTILLMLPIIGYISYLFGQYLSKNFNFIKYRLEDIKKENFTKNENSNIINEINEINESMNFLSLQLDNLIKDLKQKNNNLSNLLISMAHDIKTPITILNGYIEEIEDNMIEKDKLPSVLKHMKDEVNFLNELTIDMLEYITSMQRHKIKEKINLYNFIENEIFIILPKSKKLSYLNNIEEDFDIIFNKIDLKKICLNIFSNAIKHTRTGYIKIYNDKETILFENSGNEIKDKYKIKIFQPFFTIDKSKNRKNVGFGLGLSIVSNLSINNKYKAALYSSNKEKTIFYLEKNT